MTLDHSTAAGGVRANPLERTVSGVVRLAQRARVGYRLTQWIGRASPGVKRRLQKRLLHAIYNKFYQCNTDEDVILLNFGYVGSCEAAGRLELRPEDERNRVCYQLYHRVAGAVDLTGKDVLEVGCGRGGGAAFVAEYLGPRSMTGVDISEPAIAFCKRRYGLQRLSFATGDAENLPFDTESFDAVLNVESSHTYPSGDRFFQEVARILRPGGVMLFADFRNVGYLDELRTQVRNAGLAIAEEERITPAVLRALDLESDRKLERWGKGIPSGLKSLIPYFAAAKGTQSYKSFKSGEWEYLRFVLRKRESSPPLA